MRLFFRYLHSKRRLILLFLSCCLVFFGSFSLYHLPLEAVLYPALLCGGLGTIFCLWDFFRVRRAHEALQTIRSLTDAMTEALPPAQSVLEADYQQLLTLLTQEHRDWQTKSSRDYADMVGYYTLWAHQIKTPIASMRLHLQNEDSPLSRQLSADLRRIEQYVEMVLTFLRLGSDSTDYVFREQDLDKLVKGALRKFSPDFIDRKLTLHYSPLNATVITDEKWLSFVIEQVLSNALKYTPQGSITISLVGEKTLRIQDTGIGIAPADLPRIFENGYTGYNGRTDRKASGIGLYLCKRICRNLGHTITASSQVDVGTTIDIDLSQRKLEKE